MRQAIVTATLLLLVLGLAIGCSFLDAAPIASFTYAPSDTRAPVTVVFDASASSDPDGIIVKYEWSFGDGASGTDRSTSHVYTTSGTYTITLVVTDDKGKTATLSATITVLPPHDADTEPTASFVASPRSFWVLPLTIQFEGSGSLAGQGRIVSYTWNFGDGTTGTGALVLHTYATPGAYTVSLVVINSQGATDSTAKTIQVSASRAGEGNIAPGASFTASMTSGTAPLAVHFDATGSSDSDGVISSYDWDFGDGGAGSGVATSHIYNTAGTYTVRLTVIDNEGGYGATTQTIQVTARGGENIAPNASFTASPTSGAVPVAVHFDAAGSSDPDGSIVSYGWVFGDGNAGSGVTTFHTYHNTGTYTARLTVTDNAGATGSATQIIQVTAAPIPAGPRAVLAASPTSGTAPLTVSFDGSGSSAGEGSIVLYSWSFGDGASGSGATIAHTYTSSGTYTVRLTVTDSGNATDSAVQTIQVAAPGPPPVALSFSGSAGMLTNPFTLPAGTYKATLTTTGFCIVHVIPVANPTHFDYLFNVFEGDATNGESKLYVSTGGSFMLEFSNVSAPFTLRFEEIG